MAGKTDPVDLIRTGDLDTLKDAVAENPELLAETIEWPGEKIDGYSSHGGSLLHAAAFFNQPEIIEFLVNEKGLQVNQRNGAERTPLHYACEFDSYEAASILLQFGADPSLRCNDGTTYQLCKDRRMEELVRTHQDERLRQEALAGEERERQQAEEKRKEEEKRQAADGIWTATSPVEVTHQHELPGYQLTEVFNFSKRYWMSIVKDLQSGQPAQNIQFFDDIPDKEILRQACAKLNELGGAVDPESIGTRTAPEPQPAKEEPAQQEVTEENHVQGEDKGEDKDDEKSYVRLAHLNDGAVDPEPQPTKAKPAQGKDKGGKKSYLRLTRLNLG